MNTQRYITARQYATQANIPITAVYSRLKRAGVQLIDIEGTLMIDTQIFPVREANKPGRKLGGKNATGYTEEEKKVANRERVARFRKNKKDLEK